MSAITAFGKTVAMDGIKGIDHAKTCAGDLRDICEMWLERDHGGLDKATALRIMRARAEFILSVVAANEHLPTVAEYMAANRD